MPAKKTATKVTRRPAAPRAEVAKSRQLTPAELKAFQQKGFNKPQGFGK